MCCRDVRDFNRSAKISPFVSIYVDKELGDGVDGVEVARELYGRGYRRLYLSTGHAPKDLDCKYWLRGVVGKTPVTKGLGLCRAALMWAH